MGTIIRTSAAIGCEKIFITKGSANPWSSKVLRGSMGSHFRVPIYDGLDHNQIKYFLKKSSQIFIADNNKTKYSINFNDLDKQDLKSWTNIALIIGKIGIVFCCCCSLKFSSKFI